MSKSADFIILKLKIMHCITKTRPCNLLRFLHLKKNLMEIIDIFFILFLFIYLFIYFFLLKTLIVDTRWDRLGEAVLTSTHNLCFGSKIRKIDIPLQTPFALCKSWV